MKIGELKQLLKGIDDDEEIKAVYREFPQEESTLEINDLGYVNERNCYVLWLD